MNDLKERIIKIRENKWEVPDNINRYDFALELLENIGTTDSELRDDLILNMLWVMILNQMLTKEEIKEILSSCLSEVHLFKQLCVKESDAVFNRTFTLLVINAILLYHLEYGKELLTTTELKKLNQQLIDYVRNEKDLRGYVENKGWGHAMGHAGDTLGTIALSEALDSDDLMLIIEAVREKICIYDYVYVNEETERLASTIMKVMKRNLIQEDTWIQWIKQFETINAPNEIPQKHYFKENVKDFLRSLYFRMKYINSTNPLLNEIETTLHKLNENFNKNN